MSLYLANCVFVSQGPGKPPILSVTSPERTLNLRSVDPESLEDLKQWSVMIQKAALIESGAQLPKTNTSEAVPAITTTTTTAEAK